MKYQIENIEVWGDIKILEDIKIDDDQTFDELIEFYLPFRLSEIDPDIIQKAEVVKGIYSGSWGNKSTIALRLNPKGPRLMDVEGYVNDNLVSEPEIKEWMEQFYLSYYSKSLPSLYVALAVHADKSKDDRVLAMDIVYCLLGKIRYGGIETMEGWEERVFKTIFAEQVAIQWGDRDVARIETDIHSLRHTAITEVAKKIDSPYKLKQFSRHKTDAALKRYIHLTEKDLKETSALAEIKDILV